MGTYKNHEDINHIARLQAQVLKMNADALLEYFAHYLGRMLGCPIPQQQPSHLFDVLVYAHPHPLDGAVEAY